MQNRMLGGSDLSVSCLGLGTSTWGTTTDKDDTGQGTARLVFVQAEYSLLERGIEREVVPAAVDQNLGGARPGTSGAVGASRQVPPGRGVWPHSPARLVIADTENRDDPVSHY